MRPSAWPEWGCMEAEVFREVRHLGAVLDDMLFVDKIDVFVSTSGKLENMLKRTVGLRDDKHATE